MLLLNPHLVHISLQLKQLLRLSYIPLILITPRPHKRHTNNLPLRHLELHLLHIPIHMCQLFSHVAFFMVRFSEFVVFSVAVEGEAED